jgi:hypothetical protein
MQRKSSGWIISRHGSATIQSPLKLFFISILGLTACVSESVSLVFDTSELSQQEWTRIHNECDYEAENATASAPVPETVGKTDERVELALR